MVKISEITEEEEDSLPSMSQPQNTDGDYVSSSSSPEKTEGEGKVEVEDIDPVLREALKLKEDGNAFFQNKEWEEAAALYTKRSVETKKPQLERIFLCKEQKTEQAVNRKRAKQRLRKIVLMDREELVGGDRRAEPDKRSPEEREEERRIAIEKQKRDKEEAQIRRKERLEKLPFPREREIFHCNRAAAYLQMGEYERVVKDTSLSLDMNKANIKAYARRAKAYEALEKYEDALEDWRAAFALNPRYREAAEAVQRLPQTIKEQREQQMNEMMGKLKEVGNSVLGYFGLNLDQFAMEKDPATGQMNIQFKNKSPSS